MSLLNGSSLARQPSPIEAVIATVKRAGCTRAACLNEGRCSFSFWQDPGVPDLPLLRSTTLFLWKIGDGDPPS